MPRKRLGSSAETRGGPCADDACSRTISGVPRLFVAFEVPATVLDSIEDQLRRLKRTGADVRWSRRDHLHVTMRFLGEVPEAAVPSVGEMLQGACSGAVPIDVVAKGVGSFPGGTRPRVVWAGVQGTNDTQRGALHELRRRVHDGCSALGFPTDREDFTAHVTLGRVKGLGRAGALIDLIREDREREFGRFRVEELVLFRSQLSSDGSIYDALRRVRLGGVEKP
jgi:RNA 2',3'-cyclic 3'-phosphodiesterase